MTDRRTQSQIRTGTFFLRKMDRMGTMTTYMVVIKPALAVVV